MPDHRREDNRVEGGGAVRDGHTHDPKDHENRKYESSLTGEFYVCLPHALRAPSTNNMFVRVCLELDAETMTVVQMMIDVKSKQNPQEIQRLLLYPPPG